MEGLHGTTPGISNPGSGPDASGPDLVFSISNADLSSYTRSLLPEIQIKMTFGLPERDTNSCLEGAMLFSMVWAFEASLPPKSRAFFNILVRLTSA